MAKSKSSFLKNCVALLVITLVAGLALSAVNEITKEPIAKAEETARLEAYETVFPDAEFETPQNLDALLEGGQAAIDSVGLTGCTVSDILYANDANGERIGYVVAAVSPNGYGGDISVAVGIDAKTSTITGFSVLSNSETAGLGARCTEDEFVSQFAGKDATSIEYVKGGGAAGNQIDAISGATVTTNAVTEAVNSALAVYGNVLKEG
uniref:RnfABCDGE type electron transport complex subunit G n=1 Tax=Eubacterium sp. TaxID=142586 RepID=UPI00402720BE